MKENLNLNNEFKESFFSKLERSDLMKENTDREFYQFKNDPSKIIRVDTFDEIRNRYDNQVEPELVIDLGKKLFTEIESDYNINAPVEIITEKSGDNKESIFTITDKIEGSSLEEALGEPSKEFLQKLEDLYISISKYYLDKYNSKEAHLADLNNMTQYIYGKKKGDTDSRIYLVDTDLYINKGDAYLLHNVKWLIRHMPKKYERAISNIKQILDTPIDKDLNDENKIMSEYEIKESLSLLNGTSTPEETEDDVGFIVSKLD